MSWLQRLGNTLRSRRVSGEIDREIAFHLAERIDELVASGLTKAEATRQARLAFGNPTIHRDDAREADLFEWLHSVLSDGRYAVRGLRRSPVFTTVAIASLGLGIGINTTIFTLIDAVVLRSLPVADADRLVQIQGASGGRDPYFTNPLWEQVRNRQDVFTAATAFGETSFNLADGGIARRIRGGYVSGDYFATFLVTPAVGRLIQRADDVRGCPGIAVLSYRFWQREYGGARDAVGRSINLTGHPFQIVGVAPEAFRGADVGREADVYAPLCSEAIIRGSASALDRRSSWYLRVVGRVKPGLSEADVTQRLRAIGPATFAETVPPNWSREDQEEYRTRRVMFAAPVTRGFSDLRDRYGTALTALMAGVGLVLMIACANVANLLLGRAETRQRELAIRLAIGAARGRLTRQFLTESLLLAVAGAGVGLVLARWASPAMVTMISPTGSASAVSLDLALNGRVLLFTTALAVVTVLVFGLWPALRAARVDAQITMKPNRVHGDGTARVFGKALVAGQVALSLVLVVSAGLFIGTFAKLSGSPAGFDAGGVLLVGTDWRRTSLAPEAMPATERSMLELIRRLPGVASASSAEITPVSGSSWNDNIVMEGSLAPSDKSVTWFNEVSDGYFATMRTRLLAGRDFDPSDRPGPGRVAIVTDAWARLFVGDADPLGKQFRTKIGDSASAPITIVGVVENAKYRSLRDGQEAIAYLARSQNPDFPSGTNYLIRATGDPARLTKPVTDALNAAQPGVTLDVMTLATQLAGSLQRERMLAVLSGLFGALALLLATLGLYGVMSYAVTRRRSELGVRIALGAGPGAVIRMVLAEVARVVLVGLVLGALATLGVTTLVRSFLYAMEPTDPTVYVAAVVMLAAVALGAGSIPAWRAARVDPLDAIRES